MFAKQLDKINNLLNGTRQDTQIQADSIALISNHMVRTTPSTGSGLRARSIHTTSHKIRLERETVPQELQGLLLGLFKAKCKDMKIEFNKRSW